MTLFLWAIVTKLHGAFSLSLTAQEVCHNMPS
jgi:hypothetical protein